MISLIKWTYSLVNRIVMVFDAVFLLSGTLSFWMASPPDTRPLTWLQASAVAVTILIMFHIVIRGTQSYRVERYERFYRSVLDPAVGMVLALTRRLQWIAADVVVPVDVGGLRPQFTQQPEISDGAVLQLMHRPFKGSQGLFKVVEDYLVAVIGLLVTFPIMVVAAIAVKLEGSGPIFFKQPRVGFNSKPFMMYNTNWPKR